MNNTIITSLISALIAFGAAYALKGRLDAGREAQQQVAIAKLNEQYKDVAIARNQAFAELAIEKAEKAKTVYKTITQEKIVYVKEHPSINVGIPNYWVCFTDSAAGMSPTDCASRTDAATSTFSADTVFSTIANNYERANAAITKLELLQKLVKEHQDEKY